ncbi:hypothetical protein DSL72_004423 [Monilinia vaccinii-corymbosi]|uniref:Uncharacterized protein n=1 Tax=Monilinia vaccinii-corymbosi TaxID=61207 RepID=A0A8A3NW15_9HELO|nr:hypothetical protein DSL72_004423 [Monilinia vaccinii-corymbosi]
MTSISVLLGQDLFPGAPARRKEIHPYLASAIINKSIDIHHCHPTDANALEFANENLVLALYMDACLPVLQPVAANQITKHSISPVARSSTTGATFIERRLGKAGMEERHRTKLFRRLGDEREDDESKWSESMGHDEENLFPPSETKSPTHTYFWGGENGRTRSGGCDKRGEYRREARKNGLRLRPTAWTVDSRLSIIMKLDMMHMIDQLPTLHYITLHAAQATGIS